MESCSRRLKDSFTVKPSWITEDTLDFSFADHRDTFLTVNSAESMIEKVLRCWASLFNERAILYHLNNGLCDELLKEKPEEVPTWVPEMCVIVQKMVHGEVSRMVVPKVLKLGLQKNFELQKILVYKNFWASSFRLLYKITPIFASSQLAHLLLLQRAESIPV